MGILHRILGIPNTKLAAQPGCCRIINGRVEIDLTKAPELSSPGGALRLEGAGFPKRLLVVHGEDGQFHAVHNKCAHFGRRLDPIPGQPQLECCSVNKSKFDYEGGYVAGPTKSGVETFAVEKDGDLLFVTLS